jgi:prepilin-type N-terminal cleavage/methylation domain-containing protein
MGPATTPPMPPARHGLSLLEVLVALALLTVGLLPIVAWQVSNAHQSACTEFQIDAGIWAREIVNRLAAMDFEKLWLAASQPSALPALAPPDGFSGLATIEVNEVVIPGRHIRPAMLEAKITIVAVRQGQAPEPNGPTFILHRLFARPEVSLTADFPLAY